MHTLRFVWQCIDGQRGDHALADKAELTEHDRGLTHTLIVHHPHSHIVRTPGFIFCRSPSPPRRPLHPGAVQNWPNTRASKMATFPHVRSSGTCRAAPCEPGSVTAWRSCPDPTSGPARTMSSSTPTPSSSRKLHSRGAVVSGWRNCHSRSPDKQEITGVGSILSCTIKA